MKKYEPDMRFWNKLGKKLWVLTEPQWLIGGICRGAFIKIGCIDSWVYFLISENWVIDIKNAKYFLVSENHFRISKRNIWCQKNIFDIRNFFFISGIYKGFSDQEFKFLISKNRICDIKKSQMFHDHIRK